jgi:hypothetical protein
MCRPMKERQLPDRSVDINGMVENWPLHIVGVV